MAAIPLLAANLDWIEGILPLLFLLFWIVSQVRNLFRGANPGKPQGPVARPAPRPPVADDARETLARQIEDFLRDTEARGRVAPGGSPRPTASPAERGRRQEAAPRPAQTPARGPAATGRAKGPPPRRAAGREPPAVPAAAAAPAVGGLGSLGGHASDVARHVHDAFAHEIDHLRPGLAQADAAVASMAALPTSTDLGALLHSPATLRQLVILREVLDRPVDRW